VPGQDLAGTVVTAPQGSAFKPGDEVFARIDASRAGAAREYALARESELALRPRSLDWVQTAATPLSALTAWQCVFVQGTLEAGGVFGDEGAKKRNKEKRVLITAAGGSVGGWAVQFAAAAGADAVIAVNNGAKEKFVRGLGATEVVDYTKVTVDVWVADDPASREVDLVIDCIGGPTMKNLWAALKDGGSFVSISMPPDMVKPEGYAKTPAKSAFFIVEPLGSQLDDISRLIDAGGFMPLVDSDVEFEQFQEAFDKVEGRKTSGKVVIKVSI
ncbi:NADP-dependent oxidoreductase, partial [Candidatus Bathyarchaeota archaeon]|nr:NADP-dependent oxidoreductase [Candidatus Bathyarchaeota archaeon]